MTRINCIPPSELVRQHLGAEYRELPRVFGLAKRAIDRGEQADLSGKYTLGKGHVRFFYPRLLWLMKRQKQLIEEMINRGYTVNFGHVTLDSFPETWCNDWTPTQQAMDINRQRIKERLG